MKTSEILKKIVVFLLKNWKYTILIIAVLFFSIRGCVHDKTIINQAKKIADLGMSNFITEKDRQDLEIQFKILQDKGKIINKSNDSLKLVLAKLQSDLTQMIKKDEAELAELIKIPSDSVFRRLQPFYPNYDATPLKYPFSGSQIGGIYKATISFEQVTQEYSLQSKSLNSCLNLNSGYEKGIANLNSQIGNLRSDITKEGSEITNYQRESVILNKQVKNKQFWNRTLLATTITATLIAVFR